MRRFRGQPTLASIASVSLFFCSLFFSQWALADARLIFGHIPFYVYKQDKHGQHKGAVIDLVTLLAARAGYELNFLELPNLRFRTDIVHGRIDISIITNRYPEFMDGSVIWSANPFYYVQLAAYSFNPSLVIQKPQDLNGRSVALRRGYDYMGWRSYIEDKTNHVSISGVLGSSEQALKFMMTRRPDVLLEYVGNMEPLVQQMEGVGLHQNLLERMPFFFVVSRSRPDAEIILGKFDKAFLDLVQEGVIDREGNFLAAPKQ